MTNEHMTPSDARKWLEAEALKLGTDNQRERYAANVLPEEELTQLARAELFRVFGEIPRWSGRMKDIMARGLRHHGPHTASLVPEDRISIEFEVADVAELSYDEWERIRFINTVAAIVRSHPWISKSNGSVTVTAVTHWATCTQCDAEVCRSSAKVCVNWAGRTLTREYVL